MSSKLISYYAEKVVVQKIRIDELEKELEELKKQHPTPIPVTPDSVCEGGI